MMYQQTEIDWTHKSENNSFSQSLLEANRPLINKSCRKVLDLLLQGKELTVLSAAVDYNITSLPRRILDIEQKLNVSIPEKLHNNRFKSWYLDERSKVLIEEKLTVFK